MTSNRTGIIGVDAATQPNRMGLALGELVDGRCRVLEVVTKPRRPMEQVAAWIDGGPETVLLAVDAPLGWPVALGESLFPHRAGQALTVPRGEARRLFRRHTDEVIHGLVGKLPLEVGANLIARTAHSILCRLQEIPARSERAHPLEMAWEPPGTPGCSLIEVYPAATLLAVGASTKGYKAKSASGRAARVKILTTLQDEMELKCDPDLLLETDDGLDAAVCVLAGADFLRGMAVAPGVDQAELVRKEGWIWCREPPKALS